MPSMAQPPESIKAQPPPEVRLEKLLHPDAPTSTQPQDLSQQEAPEHQQHQRASRNAQLSPSSAAVASTVAESSYNDNTANNDSNSAATSNGTGGISGTEAQKTNHAAPYPERPSGAGAPPVAASAAAAAAGPPQPAGPVSILSPPEDSTARQHTSHDGQSGQNGTRNSGDAPLSHSPSMNHAQPPPVGPPRQGQIGYPGPNPYQPQQQLQAQAQQQPASIHAATQYAYQAQSLPHQHHDPYRAPPPALPSMRTFDPSQPQQPHQQHPPQQTQGYTLGAPMGQPMGNPLGAQMGMGAPTQMGPGPGPGPSPVGMTFYNTTLPAGAYGMPLDANGMRYALLPDLDPRVILANRQKKEIKRRTKTGCLTCRKRRIKCDEGHPTCNNCRKSKRDCLGYDPIFKPQPTPQSHPAGPVRIQPAPSPTNNNTPSGTPGLASPSATAAPSSPLPYQAPVVPSSYPQPAEAPLPSSAPRSEGGYEYSSTAIDPALRGSDNTPRSFEHSSRTYDHTTRLSDSAPRPVEPSTRGLDPRLGSVDSALRTAPPAAQAFDTYHPTRPEAGPVNPGEQQYPPPQPRDHLAHAGISAKKMKVDELIGLGGPMPPPPASPPSVETINEAVQLYYEVYVPGLTHFFESKWYDLDGTNQHGDANSLSVLQDNRPVMDLFSSFLQTISGVKTTNPSDMMYSGHLETCLVWALARLPESAPTAGPAERQPGEIPGENDAAEARARLQVLETLLTGDTLASNPCTPPPAMSTVAPTQQVRVHELEFWFRLGDYLLEDHSPAAPAHTATREACLAGMRAVLDGRENRDVLYSIAILREYTMQFDAALAEQNAPTHLDEMDTRSKLAVATRFMQDEAAKSGTTNVVRRFADLAYRAFVRPGGNVRRV